MPTGKKTTYFISYTRSDSEFALKLAKELRSAGANLWLDQLDIIGGDRWDRAVEEAIQRCQGMVTILSPEAVESPNVLDEVSYALEQRKFVIPVLYRDCEIPFRLRRVQYIDFSSDYQNGFRQLLRALHLEQLPAGESSDSTETAGAVLETFAEPPSEQAPLPRVEEKAHSILAGGKETVRRHQDLKEKRNPAIEDSRSVSSRRSASQERVMGAVTGAILGTAVGVTAMSTFKETWMWGLLTGAGWAIAGAVSRTRWRWIVGSLVGAALGWILVVAFWTYGGPFAAGGVFGAPLGAILGALASAILSKYKNSA